MVFGEFLPLSWTTEEDDSQKAHGRPQVAAMRLVMALCSAGRHLTAHMVRQLEFDKISTLLKTLCVVFYSGPGFQL